jgi:NAD(P)-dependent dehydrogenase (short-subunit alcohol dehydrogenase family)
VLLARTGASLRHTVAGLRAEDAPEAVVADLADRASLGRAMVAAAQPFGNPDILVNSAGVNLRPPMNDLSTDDWDRLLAVNLTAPFLLGQAFGPKMAGRGFGRIINVVSTQANRAFGNSGGYGASKGGPASLTRSQSEPGMECAATRSRPASSPLP